MHTAIVLEPLYNSHKALPFRHTGKGSVTLTECASLARRRNRVNRHDNRHIRANPAGSFLGLLLVTIGITASTAAAQHGHGISFDVADKNRDGILSIVEAREVFPGITLSDTNRDGILNKREAENALSGLVLSPNNQGDGTGPVREPEYRIMLKMLAGHLQTGNSVTVK